MGNERILLQKWFDEGGTIERLKLEYGIDARFGKQHPNLVSMKYNMVDVEMLHTAGHPLVREARGVVLDTADNYALVARAFSRFYNLGQAEADTINWRTARVQEKLDGSMCMASWYRGRWLVSSSGSPDASGEVNGFGLTFADLFWKTAADIGLELPDHDCGVTFVFELTGPMNRIVVMHEKSDLTLIGCRDLRTQVELTPRDAQSLYLPTAKIVREYPLHSLDGIEAALATNNPLEHEGFVVCDAQFHRIKIKDPKYLSLHRLRDGSNPRGLMEVALSGESSETYAAFPELRAILDGYVDRINSWAVEVDADYARLKELQPQKAYALEVVKTKCPAALFSIRAGKSENARDYLAKGHIDRAMAALGVSASGPSPSDRTE